MAFDFAWDFRNTAGSVTDPAYAVLVNGATAVYPHLFTNGNGLTINAGWLGGNYPDGADSSDAGTNDPRIAGYMYKANTGVGATFRVDLSSGSAPGAGTYAIDIALGHADVQSLTQDAQVLDNVTVVDDLTNGSAGFPGDSVNHYRDANGADITATSTWTGTTKSVTFSSTTVNVIIGPNNIGSFTTLAHFRLTLAAAPSTKARRTWRGFRAGTRSVIGG